MLPGNWPVVAETCLLGASLQAAVVKMQGFFWEDKGTKALPDLWATTWDARSMIHILIDTSKAAAGGAAVGAAANRTAVFLFSTKSHHWVGNASAFGCAPAGGPRAASSKGMVCQALGCCCPP